MTSKRIFRFAFLVGLTLMAQAAFSLEVPEKPKGRVSDYASLLTDDQIAGLDAELKRYEDETTNQIAVAIFKSLEGESLEDFSIRLAEKWKIGTRKDNGVILLIFLDDHGLRIEVGYGLEGTLTDAISSRIIRNDIAPRFRQGDYYGGIEAGIRRIIEATRGEYKAEPSVGNRSIGQFDIIFWGIIIFTLIFIIWGERRHRYYTFGPSGWDYGSRFPGGGWGYGGGSWGGRSSGGGFSGGGGSFGGGGASGGW
ncbi:MAG: hypothetical protein C4291_03675 [Candidatus Dadabacteria bacterium]